MPVAFSRADANAFTKTLWPVGATLRVSFLNGDAPTRKRVAEIASEWSRHANLRFAFKDNSEPTSKERAADVRIRLTPGGRSGWAYLGTTAREASAEEPTMELAVNGLEPTSDEFRLQVLHEFGHVLGLVHELQNPNAEIEWHRDAVYQEYTGPPNRWTRQQVDEQFFNRGDIPRSSYRAFDPQSVMWYVVPEKLFAKPIVQRTGADLSASDKRFVSVLYGVVAAQGSTLAARK